MNFDDLSQSVGNRLAANNVGFYFDYQNGEYGFNTSELRGADTFSPFKKKDYYVFPAAGTVQTAGYALNFGEQLNFGDCFSIPYTGSNGYWQLKAIRDCRIIYIAYGAETQNPIIRNYSANQWIVSTTYDQTIRLAIAIDNFNINLTGDYLFYQSAYTRSAGLIYNTNSNLFTITNNNIYINKAGKYLVAAYNFGTSIQATFVKTYKTGAALDIFENAINVSNHGLYLVLALN